MELSNYSSEELEEELRLRKEVYPKAALRQAVEDGLEAALFAMQNLPGGDLSNIQLNNAAELVLQLVYRTLPGGSWHEQNGMAAGWKHVGRSGIEVMDALQKPVAE